ncbi:MAG TPA: SulP family inorganic anion transporter [Ramlibacter sp.]|uniref:SulP family inorganic anion transporter n=1 Tax=Ramlibacter sp. TaxID=1917967 RepID=UPI002D16424E|nr:SulP family inorganic anion transporter [Ramlibacter sp.]HVZ43252.1 SulP family inorganic anion transporter [Ramlibacter sp.]
MVDNDSGEARIRWSTELAGGAVAGIVAVAYAMSYAALLVPGRLAPLLPTALALALVNAALGAFWLAWRSQLPFAIGGPDGNTTSILAAMAATLGIAAAGPGAEQNVLWLLALTTILCALLFLALGLGHLGLAVRYVPYPVVGGFLASTGWLICVGALRVVVPLPAQDALGMSLATLARPAAIAAGAIALVLLLVFRRPRHPMLLPALLLLAAAAMLGGLHLFSVSEAEARASGWLFDFAQEPRWVTPFHPGAAAPDWGWLAGQWLDMLAVAAVAAITVLLGASGLEVMSRRDISLDRELREHGWLNLVAAVAGGYLSLVSVSRSTVLLDSGVRTRAAGMLCAAVCVAALAGAAPLLQAVPRPVLAGFLLYLGLSILWEWVIDVRRHIGLTDWSLIFIILATTATIGFTVAVLAGIIVSCLNFALSYSRVGVVQHDLDGSALRSSVQRPARHRQLLAREGASIRVLVLRGVIFFGTASSLLDRMRGFLQGGAAGTDVAASRVLVLDFTHAASTDSSAGFTFTKIAQLAQACGVRLIVAGLGAGTRDAVVQGMEGAAIADTLDQALDVAEDALLRAHGFDPLADQEPIGDWLRRELGDTGHVQVLAPLIERREIAKDTMLMREGEASDATLFLIESGRFSVTLGGQTEGRRLATLTAGTIAGEMALYDDAQRSATVTAEHDSVVWALSRSVLERLHREAPDTAMRVHAFIVRTLAERVRQANAAAAALQRGA